MPGRKGGGETSIYYFLKATAEEGVIFSPITFPFCWKASQKPVVFHRWSWKESLNFGGWHWRKGRKGKSQLCYCIKVNTTFGPSPCTELQWGQGSDWHFQMSDLLYQLLFYEPDVKHPTQWSFCSRCIGQDSGKTTLSSVPGSSIFHSLWLSIFWNLSLAWRARILPSWVNVLENCSACLWGGPFQMKGGENYI